MDLWPIHAMIDNCFTINLAIDIQTEVTLAPREGSEVHVHVSDLDFEKTYENLSDFLSDPSEELRLLQVHLKYWQPKFGFSLKTRSQSPVGGGLGGSSSLSISLLRAFEQAMNDEREHVTLIQLAGNLEADVLRTPTGTQDYFPPVYGGLNIIEYPPDGPKVTVLDAPLEDLSKRALLVYTGKPHHSGINNWQVLKKFVDGDKNTRDSFLQIRDIAIEMKEVCEAWQSAPARP